MRNRLLGLIITILLLSPACGRAEIRYTGSSTIAIVMQESGALAAFEKGTGRRFSSIDIQGSGKGLAALIAGSADIAGSSRVLKPEEKRAKLSAVTIGYDAVGIFVHRENRVKNLTKEQIKGSFVGRIRNWKEVGGKNAPIVPITGRVSGGRGSTDFFREHILNGAPFGDTPSFRQLDLPRQQAEELVRQPNGIAYISLGLLKTLDRSTHDAIRAVTVNQIAPTAGNVRTGSYPVSRPLMLVTRGVAKGEAKEFIDFMLSESGQSIVDKNFVGLRKSR